MYNRFLSLGEYYAAGFYEEVNKSYFERYARALRRHLEHRELPPYNGEPLYPCGNFQTEHCVRPDYSFTVYLSRRLWEKDAEAGMDKFHQFLDIPHMVCAHFSDKHLMLRRKLVVDDPRDAHSRIEACGRSQHIVFL